MPDDRLDQALAAIQTPEGQAFLDTLAGPESGGRFNVRFDGSPQGAVIPDLSQHPRVAAVIPQGMPEAGRTSDAAGAYQMLSSTADAAARRLGLPGADQKQYSFDPLTQKLLAFDNAVKAYEPYGNLLSDLQSGNVDKVMGAMRSTRQWDTANPQAYAGNLARYAQTAGAGVSDAPAGRPVMGASQQDPWLSAFIGGTLPALQAKGSADSVPMNSPLGREIAAAPTSGEIPLDAARPPTGIDALAAAGGAPPIVGQGAPVTRAQLSGVEPPSSGIDALATVGKTPVAAPQSVAAPTGQPPFSPMFDAKGLIDNFNFYSSFPKGAPMATATLGMIEKMIPPGGYQVGTDVQGNTMARLMPGVAEGAGQQKQAEAIGSGLMRPRLNADGSPILDATGRPVIENLPGVVTAGAQKKFADTTADAAAKAPFTVTEIKPGNTATTLDAVRRAVEANSTPAGSPTAPPDANGVPATPPGQPVPGLYNNPAIGDYEKQSSDELGALRKQAIGNEGTMLNLQNFLDAASIVGTGRGTDISAKTASWLRSLNIDPQKLALADPAEVQKMNKSVSQMNYTQVNSLSKQPAFADFGAVAAQNPSGEWEPEANKAIAAALLARMKWQNQLFSAWDTDRRSAPGNSASHFDYPAWAAEHPMGEIQAQEKATMPQIPRFGVGGAQAPAVPPGWSIRRVQ